MTTFIDSFSEEIWKQTYKDHNDNSVNDTIKRVAKAIASVENTHEKQIEWEEKFYDLLSDFKGTCGGRTYSNAGTEWNGTTLLNCFVAPRDKYDIDSLSYIIEDVKKQALTLKSEGGWGQNFSFIRPRGSMIHGIGVETPGAVRYMEMYDKSSEIITSGSGKKATHSKAKGKIRKGACMGVLDVWHADIIEFITCKQQGGRLTKFNLSVNCSNEFMNKLLTVIELKNKGEDFTEADVWHLRFPDTTFEKYKAEWDGHIDSWESKGYPVVIHQTISVSWLWNLIMESTYNRAEPGILFLDIANEYNPANYIEKIAATNPCVTGDMVVDVKIDNKHQKMIVKDAVELWNSGSSIQIKSNDLKTEDLQYNDISFAAKTKSNAKILKITDSTTGKFIRVTEDHKVFTKNRGYVEAQYLSSNDILEISTEDTKGIIYKEDDGYEDVYDFTVPATSNFYINDILVHNCGEQTLAPAGVCCLGSINLTQFVADGKFDIEQIAKYTKYMVRFLDNVNEYSNAPLPEYIDSMRNKRRVGVGIMGWGSALFMLKTRFGSKESHQLRDLVMSTVATSAYEASIELAIEKGAFSYCDIEKHAKGKFIANLNLSDEYMTKLRTTGIRNSSLLSVQPTGNTSITANIVSGGLEPIFMPEYIRTVIVPHVPDEIKDVTPKWYENVWEETDLFKFCKEGDEEILKGVHAGTTYKIDKNRGLVKEVECQDYSVRYLKKKNEWDPSADWAVTALNGLTAEDHINDLIGFSKFVDAALSKTVNVPHEYKFEDFQNIYLDAFKSGTVKGVTTYRSGTMTSVLSSKENKENGYEEEVILDNVKMNDSSDATMKILKAEGRKWYMTIVWNETKTRPFALFVHTNHHEKTVTTHDAVERLIDLAERKDIPKEYIDECKGKIESDSNSTKLTRVISLLLRHGVAIKNIVNEMDKVENVFVGTFLFQIKKFLASFILDGEKIENEKCLECGSESIVYQEGCKVCMTCGSSKCG